MASIFLTAPIFGNVYESENNPQNSLNGNWIVAYKNWIYYVDAGGGISKASLDWKQKSRVFVDSSGIDRIFITNDLIYYSQDSTDNSEPGVFRVTINGTQRKKIIDKYSIIYAVNNWLFLWGDNVLCRVNNDGTNLVRYPFYTWYIIVVQDNIYCLDGFTLKVMSIDGKNVKKLADNVFKFTISNGLIYMITGSYGNRTIKSMKFDGSDVRVIKNGREYSEIIVNKNWIYFAGYDDKRGDIPLTMVNTTTKVEKVIFPEFCCKLNLVNDNLYFFHYVEKMGNTFNRIGIDGSNFQMISNYKSY